MNALRLPIRGMSAFCIAWCGAVAQERPFDDRPAGPGEWGFRPAIDEVVAINPPSFVWRPQKDAARYEIRLEHLRVEETITYSAPEIQVHCPGAPIDFGEWAWRVRAFDGKGQPSEWSRARRFFMPSDATIFALPAREELEARLPRSHPRLFVRPEDRERLRTLVQGPGHAAWVRFEKQCENILDGTPDTSEPARYPDGIQRGSERWREIWWGNRKKTIGALEPASNLAFAWWLGGNERYAHAARAILLATAKWDPRGATGFRYNDEAGMPYAYHFSRTYTFLQDFLTEEERETCRRVMRVRGGEMYAHLHPRHFWKPFGSHANRAWHFLGEVAIAFHDEIPEARDWLWFAMRVFTAVYPVWSDADGGWHEGLAYWRSYLSRFTWWADIMKAAVGVDAYRKPFFSRVGDYPLYLQPPGTKGGGFGDLTARLDSKGNVPLMSLFAASAANPAWEWYVRQNGGPTTGSGFIGFLRSTQTRPEPRAPMDRPTSKLFRGTGQAMLNTNLLDANDNVQVIFKSSPFGTQSHGYEAQNSFLLYAFGKRLLIRTGRRDQYGSDHHRDWMWSTRSTNSITISGKGQHKRSAKAIGRITAFETSPEVDWVEGEAAAAYPSGVERFRRGIVFVKPDLIVIHDRLQTSEPESFEWRLHAPVEMEVVDSTSVRVVNGEAACRVDFLAPAGLSLQQTDRFDPPPRPRVKLTEYHLTATTQTKSREVTFVTVLRPHPTSQQISGELTLREDGGSFVLRAALSDRAVEVRLQEDSRPLWQFSEK